jgi:hypothetical protein
MINKEIKQQIIEAVVEYFLKNKDKMSYNFLNDLFSDKLYIDEINTAASLVAGTVIVHNIPRKDKDTGIWVIRPCTDCYGGLITFWKSNKEEKFVIKFSTEQPRMDLASGRILPALKFLNTNNEYLAAGLGKGGADLIDYNDEITYEVKSNYRKKGSVSGLHDANRLVDCDGTHIVIYPVLYDGSIDFGNALYRFPNVIPESELAYSHAINTELLEVIKSGELIPEIEKRLVEEGFQWNP